MDTLNLVTVWGIIPQFRNKLASWLFVQMKNLGWVGPGYLSFTSYGTQEALMVMATSFMKTIESGSPSWTWTNERMKCSFITCSSPEEALLLAQTEMRMVNR